MAGWDELTDDIAERFDLGLKEVRALIREVLGLIDAQPGGMGGFLDKAKAAGLEEKEASWLGEPYPMALSAGEVKKALGAEDIARIAKNAGVTESITNHVLGYAIPKTIVLLTHAGAPSEAFPLRSTGVARFPQPRDTEFELRSDGQFLPRETAGGGYAAGRRLVVPGAALLITIGMIGHAITSGTARDGASMQFPPSAAESAPVTPPRAPSMSSHLASGNEPGLVTHSGPGANEVDSLATSGSFNFVFGASNITPDLALAAGRIQNLGAAIGGFGSQASRTLFAGNEFNGTLSDSARAWMMGSLQSARVPHIGVAATAGSGAANMRTALSTSQSGSSGNESGRSLIQATVDFPAIIFPANSAKIPSSSIPVLRRIAEQIKQLPPGTAVQLNGYTHGMRMSAAGVELSQRRAESVSEILVHEGVSPAALSAKGYGSASVAALTNGTMEGRSSTRTPRNDRRVEFRVVQQRP